ncbi:Uncharacterised protein [Chlamydia trachomatis]|nr:Uncharacterised protein [Chlamydia trachomatis]
MGRFVTPDCFLRCNTAHSNVEEAGDLHQGFDEQYGQKHRCDRLSEVDSTRIKSCDCQCSRGTDQDQREQPV